MAGATSNLKSWKGCAERKEKAREGANGKESGRCTPSRSQAGNNAVRCTHRLEPFGNNAVRCTGPRDRAPQSRQMAATNPPVKRLHSADATSPYRNPCRETESAPYIDRPFCHFHKVEAYCERPFCQNRPICACGANLTCDLWCNVGCRHECPLAHVGRITTSGTVDLKAGWLLRTCGANTAPPHTLQLKTAILAQASAYRHSPTFCNLDS
jgi:hypothetical protein